MKKIILSLFTAALLVLPSTATTKWTAADRVAPVGKVIVEKNSLPAKLQFKLVDETVDNSKTSTTNIVQISKADLTYAGNDNEVAAVVAYELGQIINGKTGKDNIRAAAKAMLAEKLSKDNIVNTTANSEFWNSKTALRDKKEADMTAVDLMVKAGYNPVALITIYNKTLAQTRYEWCHFYPLATKRMVNIYEHIYKKYPQYLTNNVYENNIYYKNFLSTTGKEMKKIEKKLNK